MAQSIPDIINKLPKVKDDIYNSGYDLVKSFYDGDFRDFHAPPSAVIKHKDKTVRVDGKSRKAKDSLFNRYSLFFFNNTQSGATSPEDYVDSPNRIGDKKDLFRITRDSPTTANIVKWAKSGTSNGVEYAWEDFLWCKNYGIVPNNYMVTLRRFANPTSDDLFNADLMSQPDIGRMVTYIDGETNKWESAGLKWSHGLKWKEFTSEIQRIDNSNMGWGTEGGSGVGGLKRAVSLLQPDYSNAVRGNESEQKFDPYQNKNATFGPIDVINRMQVRDTGLEFTQEFTLTFEYELRSISGINPKVAFIDLLSNVLVCTANRGSFWGGDVRYYGTNARKIKPFGNPNLLQQGKYTDFITSMFKGDNGIFGMLGNLANANGGGIMGLLKGVGSNMLSQFAGEQLDKMGRPEVQAIDSLLSGDPTGEWHVSVGNPANPIISVGNLILDNTEIEFGGQIGPDDFPTKLKVVCTLKPAMPRDRTDIISMFSRNNRTYLSSIPQTRQYAGQSLKGKNAGSITDQSGVDTNKWIEKNLGKTIASERFPNHFKSESQITEAIKGIY